MIHFISITETKTTLDIPSRKGSGGGNWLQTVHECEAERLGLEEGEGRSLDARDLEAVAIGGAPTAHKRKNHFPPPVGRTPAGNQLAGNLGSGAHRTPLPPAQVLELKACQQ